MSLRTSSFLALSVMMVCACGSPSTIVYKTPPAESYRTTARRVTIRAASSQMQVTNVAPEFFRDANVKPLIGRFFIDGDYRSSSAVAVAVLSYELWTTMFGASASIIGQAIDLDGRVTTVVGIAPKDFAIPEGVQLWTPME